MKSRERSALFAGLLVAVLACASAYSEPISELWVQPSDLASRDLFVGPGGSDLVPHPATEFRFKGLDTKGHSKGYDVEDPRGRKWDVKIGEEAQSEVAVSRILWAIGYHQPIVYYVPHWRMTGGPTATPEPGRFRLASDHKTLGEWSWSKNPFVGTRPFRGLVIANVLLNNWDLDTSNNRVYGPERRLVVQDLGASLGKTSWPFGTRNDIRGFESQGLIKTVHKDRVEFDFHARHKLLVGNMSPADVTWTCRLLSRLTDRQLDDAFRAAGYSKPPRERYVRKIKQKVREGLALEARRKGLR